MNDTSRPQLDAINNKMPETPPEEPQEEPSFLKQIKARPKLSPPQKPKRPQWPLIALLLVAALILGYVFAPRLLSASHSESSQENP